MKFSLHASGLSRINLTYIFIYADELCFGIANGRVLNFGALCTFYLYMFVCLYIYICAHSIYICIFSLNYCDLLLY